MKKQRVIIRLLLTCLLLLLYGVQLLAGTAQNVYVIPVKETIDPGLAKFVERSYREAQGLQAEMVLLEVDTPGGRVDAALQIRDVIRQSSIPTTALVQGGAISAGALVTLACQQIAMVPGSTIGDAEPRVGNERADEKYVSYWAKELSSTAQANGRDPLIAIAMADRDAGYPGLAEKGKLLTLTYMEAEKVGYTDFVVQDRSELLTKLSLQAAQIIEAKLSAAEKITRIITNPYVAPFLLTLGIAGIIIEVFTIGWGIAGTVGVLSLILYFWGHLLAGFSGWEAILLFLFGMILLAVEAFMPGFGIPGFTGIGCIFTSIVLAAPSWETGLISLVIALVGSIILLLISFKVLTKRRFWDRLILRFKYEKDTGYVPQSQDLGVFTGKQGVALTTLRPAGTMELEDGTRLDVVTEGEFVPHGEKIEVVRVEGARIVVREKKNEEGQ